MSLDKEFQLYRHEFWDLNRPQFVVDLTVLRICLLRKLYLLLEICAFSET